MKLLLFLFGGALLSTPTCKKIAPLSKEEMMTGKTWRVDELIHNVNGENSHYIRGERNTTNVDYDKMQFTFNTDGTGTHTDQFGKVHSTSWYFDRSNNRTLHLSVHLSSDINFSWRMVEVTKSTIYATTPIAQYGDDILESFRLTSLE